MNNELKFHLNLVLKFFSLIIQHIKAKILYYETYAIVISLFSFFISLSAWSYLNAQLPMNCFHFELELIQ